MVAKVRVPVRGVLMALVLWFCGTVVSAQYQTELKVMRDTSVLGRPVLMRGMHRVDRVVETKEEKEAQKKAEPVVLPPSDSDPRHKLDSVSTVSGSDTAVESGSLIYLERTDVMMFDEEELPDIQVLVGDVLMRHDDAYLYCDSAHLNKVTNSFEAFGRVRIEQGDSVSIYSRHLRYNGNTKVARLYHDVRLVNGETTLTTDSLTYDRERKVGYYLCGGTLRDSLNTLVSKKGYYYTDTKQAEFKTNVLGYNDDNRIESDTLMYNTESKVAEILGPTLITHSDSSTIYSELGWYDTGRDLAQLLSRSLITHSEGKMLEGDTIFYDKAEGIGEAFGNVRVTDTVNSIILTGHYGYYREEGEESLLTDSALMREFSQGDTIYAHADTLFAYQASDSSKVVHLFHHGRLYCDDFQGVADSIYYTSRDSILHLRQMPVLWNEDWQITGDSIDVFPTGGELNRVHVMDNAMIAQEQDTVHYNQMSGREFMAYIGDEQLDSLHISGNAESIFFPVDNGRLIGLNKIQSSYMTVFFTDGKLDRLTVFPSPTANMYPMAQVTEQMLHLPNFTWQADVRPLSRDDLFRHPERITQAQIDEKKTLMREQQKEERRRAKSE